jgi:hypothetical protein
VAWLAWETLAAQMDDDGSPHRPHGRRMQRDEVRPLWAGAGPNGEGECVAGRRARDAGRAAQSADAGAVASSRGQMENDPRLLFLRSIIFLLTGEEARVFDPASLTESGDQPATPEAGTAASPTGGAARERAAGAGVEYDYHASHKRADVVLGARRRAHAGWPGDPLRGRPVDVAQLP